MFQALRVLFLKPAPSPVIRHTSEGHIQRALVLLVALAASISAADNAPSVVDFRYAPPQWQTAICFPDDPNKSLVDRSGELLYDYGQGEREFATRIAIEVSSAEVWQRQQLEAPRIPLVRTEFKADKLQIRQEAFALPNPGERG